MREKNELVVDSAMRCTAQVDRGGCGHARVLFWDMLKRWLQRPETALSCQTLVWGVEWLLIAWLLEPARLFPLRHRQLPVVDRRSADVDGSGADDAVLWFRDVKAPDGAWALQGVGAEGRAACFLRVR